MGATQSKKRKKERRKKKLLQLGGRSDLGVPRSASVDVIRTLSVASTCPYCHHSLSSTPGGQAPYHHTLAPGADATDLYHRCLQSQYHDLRGGSCPSCDASNYFLSSSLEHSTMSLNRNLTYRTTATGPCGVSQSRSSEFAELMDVLHRRDAAGVSSSSRTTSSGGGGVSKGAGGLTKSCSGQASLLADEEVRLGKWKERKIMAQQLRSLRRHLQEQEAKSHQSKQGSVVMSESELITNLESRSLETSAAQTVGNGSGEILSTDGGQVVRTTQVAEVESSPSSPIRKSIRSKFTRLSNYRYLDNHPVLSKLQNEQNNRLESMERRMKGIRISAMQEAERRKFAEIFPAKDDKSETEKVLQEAKESLEKLKEEKRKKYLDERKNVQSSDLHKEGTSRSVDQDTRTEDDSGEIIPVHVLPRERSKSPEKGGQEVEGDAGTRQPSQQKDSKSIWSSDSWPNINLSHPVTWLWLPFLLFPLILRLVMSLVLQPSPSTSVSNLKERHRKS